MTGLNPIIRIFVFLHTILVYAWTIVGTIVFGILAILFSFFSKTGNSVHLVARIWGRSILWVSGIRVSLRGEENLSRGRSCIYMSNHQSSFDIPVLLSELRVQFRWLAKAELFKIPIFGRGMKGAGYISIDRSNRKSAFLSLGRAAESIRNGKSVLIFPEGTRSADGRLLPFKKGGFVLAVDAGVPIVPLVVTGTHTIKPKDSMLIRRRPVRIEILPPIETADFSRANKDALMERVRQVMSERLAPDEAGSEALQEA